MKKLIVGLVIGLMLGMSTNAFAAIGDSVQAVFAEFNYVVNGQSKTLDAPVLVYEGTSYVRTTQISNLLGYDVTYKVDSRTIEFNKPEQTSSPVQQTVNEDSTQLLEPSPLPDGVVPMESVESTATPDPNATPIPSAEQSPTVTPSPTPAPSNVAQCQAIRDDYGYRIVAVGYEDIGQGPKMQKVLVLKYERDQKLSAAGCN